MTCADLIAELSRFPRNARVSVRIEVSTAATLSSSNEPGNFALESVIPIGCNLGDVQIVLAEEV